MVRGACSAWVAAGLIGFMGGVSGVAAAAVPRWDASPASSLFALSPGNVVADTNFKVFASGGTISVVDFKHSAGSTSSASCAYDGFYTVSCPADGFTGVFAALGPGNDTFTTVVDLPTTVFGGAGNDAITGGGVADLLVGAPGNDLLLAPGRRRTLSVTVAAGARSRVARVRRLVVVATARDKAGNTGRTSRTVTLTHSH